MSRFQVVALDVSRFVSDELKTRCGGTVWELSVYDSETRTYCCDTSPSYVLYPVSLEPGTLPEDEDEQDQLNRDLIDAHAGTDVCSYYYCRTIEALDPSHFSDLNFEVDEEDKAIDEAIEAQCANPVTPACIA